MADKKAAARLAEFHVATKSDSMTATHEVWATLRKDTLAWRVIQDKLHGERPVTVKILEESLANLNRKLDLIASILAELKGLCF